MNNLNKLIEKYNRPGPRYTSYPPVPFWSGPPQEKTWLRHILENYDPLRGVDLYVHVPYCEKLCYYCGCNRTITKNHAVEDPFLEMLLKEWELYCQHLDFIPKINSLHFGGGTPTFLSPQNLQRLIETLTSERTTNFIGSIEIDPRTCQDEHLKVMAKTGMQRVSLGIQDFDPGVQEAINRHQPVSMVKQLVEKLRATGMTSINFDLIYGLPRQTLSTITNTIEVVSQLKPDLIAFYGYAHLPDRIKNQRLIKEQELPSPEQRQKLYETGKKILTTNGYDEIGLDHFALPGSYLHKAMTTGELHRNFMGYVDKKSNILIGLGPTAISDSSLSFIQNAKELDTYQKLLNQDQLPLDKGHVHTADDLSVQRIILDLMCDAQVEFRAQDLPAWEEVQQELKEFAQDGLLEFSEERLKLTDTGKVFMRNVAMVFDFHLRQQRSQVKFSQTI